MPPGADQAFDIGFHQNLQHGLRNGSQKIAFAALLQQLDRCHSLVGHRVLGRLSGEVFAPPLRTLNVAPAEQILDQVA